MDAVVLGLTSAEPGAQIQAGQRWFTIYTLQEACEATPQPALLVAQPMVLPFGELFTLDAAIVDAYDTAGNFIPEVPVEILDPDPSNDVLHREVEATGRKVIEFRTLCERSPGLATHIEITILRRRSSGD